MDNIEALVEQSAERAKLSFKPLLDNATEVKAILFITYTYVNAYIALAFLL